VFCEIRYGVGAVSCNAIIGVQGVERAHPYPLRSIFSFPHRPIFVLCVPSGHIGQLGKMVLNEEHQPCICPLLFQVVQYSMEDVMTVCFGIDTMMHYDLQAGMLKDI